jgi:hypothetical protein
MPAAIGRLAKVRLVMSWVTLRASDEFELRAGGEWARERMTRRFKVEGRERVPRAGPLLLVANNPRAVRRRRPVRFNPKA